MNEISPETMVTLVCLGIAAGAWLVARFAIKVHEEDQRERAMKAREEQHTSAFR